MNDRHWQDVIGACVRADDPLAFGIDRLRHARATLAEQAHTAAAGTGNRPVGDPTGSPTEQKSFDAALNNTRAARVEALADRPPPHLVDRLGPVPTSAAGRAVWCYWATGIETTLDYSDGEGRVRSAGECRTARRHISLADRHLSEPATTGDLAGWQGVALRAARLDDQLRRRIAARHFGPPAAIVPRSMVPDTAAAQGPDLSV